MDFRDQLDIQDLQDHLALMHFTGPTGAAGPTGYTGPNPTAGLNAMIPYEPWNQNIVTTDASSAIVSMIPGKVYFIQFIAPSTGYYTDATMLLGFNDILNIAGVSLGVGYI